MGRRDRGEGGKNERLISKILDIVGEIIAVVLVFVWILSITNAIWGYMDKVPVLVKILNAVITYGGIVLMAIVGLEAMSKRNIVFRIIFLLLVAIIIISSFFPEIFSKLVGYIPAK